MVVYLFSGPFKNLFTLILIYYSVPYAIGYICCFSFLVFIFLKCLTRCGCVHISMLDI